MTRFYIGSSLSNQEEVTWYAQRLKELGWEHTYDWTKNLGQEITAGDLAEYAARERRAIGDSDVVILLLPGGRGTHVELGLALALGKKVFLCAGGEEAFSPENTVAFYHLPGVVRLTGSREENLKEIEEIANDIGTKKSNH